MANEFGGDLSIPCLGKFAAWIRRSSFWFRFSFSSSSPIFFLHTLALGKTAMTQIAPGPLRTTSTVSMLDGGVSRRETDELNDGFELRACSKEVLMMSLANCGIRDWLVA